MVNRKFVDLHVHSNASDGSYAPAEVVNLAAKAGLNFFALTDHDTMAGLKEAAAKVKDYPHLAFIPGIELSAKFYPGVMHILGLGIDPNNPQLIETTAWLRESRNQRNPKIVKKLQDMGVDLCYDELLEMARKTAGDELVLGRLHIALALMRKGYAKDVSDAFEKYIGNHAPAFVVKDHLLPSVAISAINESGGTAVLAHPVQLEYANEADLERIVKQLIHAGLGGIECYHSSHNNNQTRLYLELAQKYKLITTGGSDYHGGGKPSVSLGKPTVTHTMVGKDILDKWSQNF